MENEQQMNSDALLLAAVPAMISVTDLLKATPVQDGGDRFIYLEASNESLDQQGEVVLAKALAESAQYFLKFGNLDIDHYTQIGAKAGIPNYELFEIGRPIDVKVENGTTFVKGQIYSGSGAAADKANAFWASLTELNPPARWYPSVGGAVLEKAVVIDPETKARKAVIKKVRWSNIGFSKTPVNADLATVQTVPFGALTKSFCPLGGCFDLSKSEGFDAGAVLSAGYGTDSATLTGGAAIRKQSLQKGVLSYWDFRDAMAGAIRSRKVGAQPADMVKFAMAEFGLSPDKAAISVERFLGDLQNARSK